jgi:hypothetical protein
MKSLLKKHIEIREYLSAKYSGYFVAFIFSTARHRSASELIITNTETGKEIKFTPQQVYGQTEEEVKKKIINIINEPFKKEDI